MQRWIDRATRALSLMMLISVLALPGSSVMAEPVAAQASPTGSAAELALAITGGGTLTEQIAATRQALALGGLATVDGGVVVMPAAAPVASAAVSSAESARLAIEARQRSTSGRITLAQLAQQLADFGWPYREDAAPSQQLVGFLAQWVAEAQARPDDPESFTPLFLAAMAQQQQPAVDIASGSINPEELRLTLLELQLLAAAFDRSVAKVPGGMAGAAVGEQRAALRAAAPLGQADPCTEFKKRLGNLGREYVGEGAGAAGDAWSEVGAIGFSEGVGQALDASVGAALNPALEAAGASPHANFGNAMSALGSASKLWKLASFYANTQATLTASTYETHRAQPQPGEEYVLYLARAGVSQDEYDEYLRAVGGEAASETDQAVKDCLGAAGLPTPTELVDLAKDAENWRAKWEVTPGGGGHVSIQFVAPGQTSPARDWENQFDVLGSQQVYFERSSPTSVEAPFRLVINKEDPALHASPTAVEKVAKYQVCAQVRAAQAPGLGTLVNAAKGGLGLVDALVDAGAGWMQEMLPPEVCAPLAVSYHEEECPTGALPMQLGLRAPGEQTAASAAAQALVCLPPSGGISYVSQSNSTSELVSATTVTRRSSNSMTNVTVTITGDTAVANISKNSAISDFFSLGSCTMLTQMQATYEGAGPAKVSVNWDPEAGGDYDVEAFGLPEVGGTVQRTVSLSGCDAVDPALLGPTGSSEDTLRLEGILGFGSADASATMLSGSTTVGTGDGSYTATTTWNLAAGSYSIPPIPETEDGGADEDYYAE